MESENIKTVLESLQDQANGDIGAVLEKITHDYSMTWVEKRGEDFFPCSGFDSKGEAGEIYADYDYIYDVRNIAEGEDVVFVECIETVIAKKSNKKWIAPLVLVLEMENGKIKTGRHYLDPVLSEEDIPHEKLEKLFGNTKTKRLIGKDK